jgi:photosynthetic reaction center H subunit
MVRQYTTYDERDERPEHSSLARLSEFRDLEIARGQPAVRGWTVLGPQGQLLGQVEELIADREIMKVRYLSVALSGFDVRHDRQPLRLVPIGRASLDREDRHVVLNAHDAASIREFPAYEGGPITRQLERKLLEGYLGGMDPGIEPERIGYYEHEDFDADRFYNPRRPGPTRFRGESATD